MFKMRDQTQIILVTDKTKTVNYRQTDKFESYCDLHHKIFKGLAMILIKGVNSKKVNFNCKE